MPTEVWSAKRARDHFRGDHSESNREFYDKPKKRAQPERDLQAAAVAMIEAMGIPVFALQNAGERDVRAAAQMKRAGMRAGIPDLCLILPAGRSAYIELKIGNGKLSPLQENWRDALRLRDHWWAECRTLGEVAGVVREWATKANREGQ